MANLGSVATIINASECILRDNGSADTYVLLQDINLHVGRPEFRDPSTGAGAVYSYGKGEHHLTGTIMATPTEIDIFFALNDIGTDGQLTSNDWEIVAKDVSGTATQLDCPGFLNPIDMRKGPEGKVFLDIFIRITTDIVVASVPA